MENIDTPSQNSPANNMFRFDSIKKNISLLPEEYLNELLLHIEKTYDVKIMAAKKLDFYLELEYLYGNRFSEEDEAAIFDIAKRSVAWKNIFDCENFPSSKLTDLVESSVAEWEKRLLDASKNQI